MENLKKKKRKNFVILLPNEILYEILSFLSPKEVGKCALLNKLWYKLCLDDVLWKNHFQIYR